MPIPPGSATKPSASSAISALRSCIEPTTRRSDSPGWAISRSTSACGITPTTSPPASSTASATRPSARRSRRRRRARCRRSASAPAQLLARPRVVGMRAGARAGEDAEAVHRGRQPILAADADHRPARDLQGLRHPRPVRRADRRRRRRAGRARVRPRARRPARQAGERAADRARARHAPERAGARRALPRRHGRRGRARARRRDGRDRDALLPRRLARARRRADVHRLAQPEGVHRGEARARGRAARCRATRASATSGELVAAGLPRARRRARRRRARSTSTPSSTSARSSFIDPSAIRPLRVVLDGGNGMAGPMVGPILERLDGAGADPDATGSPTASSPTTSRTRCCPRTAAS